MRIVKFFLFIGCILGVAYFLLHDKIDPHLPRQIRSLLGKTDAVSWSGTEEKASGSGRTFGKAAQTLDAVNAERRKANEMIDELSGATQ